MLEGGDFFQISLALGCIAALGVVARFFNQPLIIAILIGGVLVGPAGFSFVSLSPAIEFFSQLGIALLLFLVGLRLDIQLIRHMGPVALATGLGQILGTFVAGGLLAHLMGLDWTSSLYVGIALTFSSTILIVKLLSDKKEIDSLHGQISVGCLIVQDVVVVALMIVLSALAQRSESDGLGDLLVVGVQALVMIGALFVVARFILPRLLQFMSGSRELLVLFAIAWAGLMAGLAHEIGLSKEVGAFLAGVSLASTPFRDSLSSRLVSIRDFLLVFFFVALGSEVNFEAVQSQLGTAFVLSVFVLILKPIIMMLVTGVLKYRLRTGFLAGVSMAQISEFSLILASLGMSIGHIDAEVLSLITLVGLVTIFLSTYGITYSQRFYSFLYPLLKIFEAKRPSRDSKECEDDSRLGKAAPQVLVFGLGRLGLRVASGLKDNKISVLGIDFDPQAIRDAKKKRIPSLYGDASDPEFYAELPLEKVEWVVCCVSDLEVERVLADSLEELNYQGELAVVSLKDSDEKHMKLKAVGWWLKPFELASERIVEEIQAKLPVAEQ